MHLGDARKNSLNDVVVTHAHATASHNGITFGGRLPQHRFECGLIVTNNSVINGLCTSLRDKAHQHRAIALTNLSGSQNTSVINQFITRRKNRHAHSRINQRISTIHTGQDTSDRWTNFGTNLENLVSSMDIIAGSSHRIARTNFFENLNQLRTIKIATIADKFCVLNHDNRIGSIWHRSTGHNANRCTVSDCNIGWRTSGNLTNNS